MGGSVGDFDVVLSALDNTRMESWTGSDSVREAEGLDKAGGGERGMMNSRAT